MQRKLKCAVMSCAVSLLVACGGGGGGGGGDGALDKYVGNYSYCDLDHTLYSVAITSDGDDGLNTLPTEVTYQNANCTGSVLGTYSWTGPAKVTLTSTGTATVSGDGLPSSLIIDKFDATASNIRDVLSGPAVDGNCITYPRGEICYDDLGPIDATAKVGLYLSSGKLYEMLLEGGVYVVQSVYNK